MSCGWCIVQDIAVVPFLILLPIIETTDLEGQSTATLLTLFVPTALQTLGSLALLLLGGRLILRRVFELVAESRSDETFVALCLLTVTGASLLTQRLGFSDTLGAFIAGVLLAETNYRTQVSLADMAQGLDTVKLMMHLESCARAGGPGLA